MKNRTQRIKQALTITFVAGMIAGGIMGSIGGYLIGAGKLHIELPEQEPCYAIECTHYTREVMGGAIVYKKDYCCGSHGHDCSSY
jgi:hypothetical protein